MEYLQLFSNFSNKEQVFPFYANIWLDPAPTGSIRS